MYFEGTSFYSFFRVSPTSSFGDRIEVENTTQVSGTCDQNLSVVSIIVRQPIAFGGVEVIVTMEVYD